MSKNFKVITTNSKYPDVLVERDVDIDNGDIIVEIKAFAFSGTENEQIIIERIIFGNLITAFLFINNFDINSANDWCKEQDIVY